MGNFFAIVAANSLEDEARLLFDSGLQVARRLKNSVRHATDDGLRVASFPRQNGTGGSIVEDPESGTWLLTLGTWFHPAALGPGDERGLLQRYQEIGPVRLALELEGFFLVLVGHVRKNELLVITDVVGSCHAFWRQFPNIVALSGSSLLLAGLRGCSLDPIAGQEFIHTGIIYQDRTLFSEVRKLAPASVYRFKDGQLKHTQRYWSPSRLQPERLRGDAAVEMLADSIVASVGAIARVFPNPVCDLTGGYDSRAVVAGFASIGTAFATTVSGPAASGDVSTSKSLATLLQVPHLHFGEQPAYSFASAKEALFFTDGECDLVDYARVLRTHRVLADQFEISINGSFGELARGYWWELLVPRTGKRDRLDGARLARCRYVPRRVLSSLFRRELRVDMVPHFARVIAQNNADLLETPNTFQMDSAYLGMRMQRWQGRIATSTNRLWPCLSPFLFKSTLEVILQTENVLRRRSLMIRKMLRVRHPRLADFPLEHGYPAAPATLRNLHRFRPLLLHYGTKALRRAGLGQSYESSIQSGGKPARLVLWQEPEVKTLLEPASMRCAELFDPDALRAFITRSQETDFSEDSEWRRLFTLECALAEVQA